MPSFDVVSEVDKQEVSNATDQANRELATRFDFNGVDASFKQQGLMVTVAADSDFQINQMLDILRSKLVKRGIDVACLEEGDIVGFGKLVKMDLTMREGIEQLLSKKLVKLIKGSKIKVQAAIQGEKLRVTGKKRDDLQQVMALLKDADVDMPLQFNNFRD